MTDSMTLDAHGDLIEPTTLRIQRFLPGSVDRVWAYLTESDLRRKWLASGEMELTVGAPFELVWRNDELTDPPGTRPEGFGTEHSMESRITRLDPPHAIAFTWGEGEVSIELAQKGERVLLTLVHTRIVERTSRVMIGAGWHAHLDILVARVSGTDPAAPFWDTWKGLKEEYETRIPG